MLQGITELSHAAQKQPDAPWVEKFEMVADTEGKLTIRPLLARLSCYELQNMVDKLREGALESISRICFDFSIVRELTGPWGSHFAILIRLANEVDAPVHLIGLYSQPTALAWLFRRSPQLRLLLQFPSNT